MIRMKIVLTLSALAGVMPEPRGLRADDSNWPQFRGTQAGGVAEGHKLPLTWSVKDKKNIVFSQEIPGLGHSSPIIWGDHIYVTTAISKDEKPELKVGLYGSGDSAKDVSEQHWMIYCLDKKTGKVIWEKVGFQGVPRAARHTKATYCNSTPATDGHFIVTFLGNEGLFCFDMNGELVWRKDFGKLEIGPAEYKEMQWGFASSPTIHDGKVIVQVDTQNDDFIACFDLKSGKKIWDTPRRDDSTWGSPTVYFDGASPRVAVNGYKEIAGYDAENGDQLWRMKSGGGDVPVPTPIAHRDLVYITNAHGDMAPLYAIHASAIGTLDAFGKKPSKEIAWAERRNGAYMQTPIIYGDYIYSCSDRGILKCYEAKTGKLMYEQRLGKGSSGYTPSPVAGDDKLYFTSEDGDVHVIKPGPKFEQLAMNDMDEICMATPAVSDGVIYFRTKGHVVAVSDNK